MTHAVLGMHSLNYNQVGGLWRMKNVVVVKKTFPQCLSAVWYAGLDDAVVLMQSNIGRKA